MLSDKSRPVSASEPTPQSAAALPGYDPLEHQFSLRVTLLANNRDHHATTSVGDFKPEIRVDSDRILVTHPEWFAMSILAPGGGIVNNLDWYRDFDLPMEAERDSTLPTIISALAKQHPLRGVRPGPVATTRPAASTSHPVFHPIKGQLPHRSLGAGPIRHLM